MGEIWVTFAMAPVAMLSGRLSHVRHGFVVSMCVCCATLAVMVLLGWATDRAGLARWVPELPTMKVNTALAVLAVALGLLRFGLRMRPALAAGLSVVPLLAVALMAATLVEHATGFELGIDQLVLPDLATLPADLPGRPAPGSALALLLLGVAARVAYTTRSRWRPLPAVVAFAIGYVASVALMLGVSRASGIGAESLPTTVCIVMLSAAALTLTPWRDSLLDEGSRSTSGGRFMRAATPVAMILPAAVMWLQYLAEVHQWWEATTGMVVAVSLSALLLLVLAWRSARWINRLERNLRVNQRLLEQRVDERTAQLMDSAAHLRASEAQLARLVDNATTVIITLNASLRIVVFNHEAERVFGTTAERMIGQPLDRLLPERSRATHAKALERFATTGDTMRRMGGEAQLHGVRATGEEFPIAASISQVSLPHGPMYTVVLRDLSEAEALEREHVAREVAEAASRGKTELLSHVSHELRTPLNAILGFAQLLRMRIGSPMDARQRGYLAHIELAGQQLEMLITDLLDIGRADAGRVALDLEPVDAAPVIHVAMAMVSSMLEPHDVTLLPPVFGPVPAVLADPRRLLQVVTNLLNNAIKYNRRGGTVAIALRGVDRGVAIDIGDTGDGLNSEQLAHLFEPFNRLGRERGSIQGTGIGLTLSHRLVTAMGGRIEVVSEPGVGSRFRVWLRAVDSNPDHALE